MQQELGRTNRLFEAAVAARDLAPLDSVYTAGARILPPGGEMVSGRDNITRFWQSAIEALNVESVQLETVEFEAAGETGHEIGRTTLNFRGGGAPMHAKYVVVWKVEGGAWKWHVDIWNPNS